MTICFIRCCYTLLSKTLHILWVNTSFLSFSTKFTEQFIVIYDQKIYINMKIILVPTNYNYFYVNAYILLFAAFWIDCLILNEWIWVCCVSYPLLFLFCSGVSNMCRLNMSLANDSRDRLRIHRCRFRSDSTGVSTNVMNFIYSRFLLYESCVCQQYFVKRFVNCSRRRQQEGCIMDVLNLLWWIYRIVFRINAKKRTRCRFVWNLEVSLIVSNKQFLHRLFKRAMNLLHVQNTAKWYISVLLTEHKFHFRKKSV